MSTQINKAFVHQFEGSVHHLLQQEGSKLGSTLMREAVTGKAASFERLGKVTARKKTTRHGVLTADDTPHSRRRVYLEDYYHKDFIDDTDRLRLLIEPNSEYVKAFAHAMGRQLDAVVIDALEGTATEVSDSDGESTVSFDSTMVVDEDFGTGSDTNLTLEKIIEAKRLLDKEDGGSSDKKYLVTNTSGISNLLNLSTVTSSDYNTVKALMSGDLDTYVGFKFITLGDGLLSGTADGTDTDPVITLAYKDSAGRIAVGQDIKAKIERIPERDADQVLTTMTVAALRMEEKRVAKIECVQSA